MGQCCVNKDHQDRLFRLEAANDDLAQQSGRSAPVDRQAEIACIEATLAALGDASKPAQIILQQRLKFLLAEAPPGHSAAAPSSASNDFEEVAGAAEAEGAADNGADSAMYTHEHGPAATLQAMIARGDSALFSPCQENFDRVVQELNSTDYEPIDTKNPELEIFTKTDSETELKIVKTIDIVPGADVHELYRLTHDVDCRDQWERKHGKDKKKWEKLDTYVEGEDELYLFQYPGAFIISGREFVDRRITYRDPDRELYVCISSKGDDLPNAPAETKKYVRGTTLMQVTMVYKVPEGAAHMLLILGHPGGSIPVAAVNKAAESKPKAWHKTLIKAYKAEASPNNKHRRSNSVSIPRAVPAEAVTPKGMNRAVSVNDMASADQHNPLNANKTERQPTPAPDLVAAAAAAKETAAKEKAAKEAQEKKAEAAAAKAAQEKAAKEAQEQAAKEAQEKKAEAAAAKAAQEQAAREAQEKKAEAAAAKAAEVKLEAPKAPKHPSAECEVEVEVENKSAADANSPCQIADSNWEKMQAESGMSASAFK